MSTTEQPSSLWPKDLVDRAVEAPIAILKEQGSELQKLTKNMLKGEPRVTKVPGEDGDRLIVSFVVVAPALADYEVELLSFEQSTSLYPIEVSSMGFKLPKSRISSAEQFRHYLRGKLATPKVKNVISSLLAQAKAIS